MNTASHLNQGCVVCGLRDERALATLKLGEGPRVLVCGSHDLVYRRSGKLAENVEDLRAIARERRDTARRGGPGDELGDQLSAAFSRDRRAANDRRR